MSETAEPLRIGYGSAYEGQPYRSGDGVWTAPLMHSTWYILDGAAEVRRGPSGWRCGPGEGIVLPSGWRRWQAFAPASRIVSLGLVVAGADGLDALDQPAPVVLPPPLAQPLAAAARAAIAALPGAGPLGILRARAALDGYAVAWLDAMLAAGARLRDGTAADPRLARLRQALAREPRLGPLPWPALEAATGLSRSQLDRRCRAAWGFPVRGLRDRLAVDHVRVLLADPGRNLAGIAAELGAVDASHLVKWYRRCTGRTPGAERTGG